MLWGWEVIFIYPINYCQRCITHDALLSIKTNFAKTNKQTTNYQAIDIPHGMMYYYGQSVQLDIKLIKSTVFYQALTIRRRKGQK